ncbi:hypothetical protein RFI_04239 [Reticulomyxa filosa]|uniref:AIG1-type G domain-containing protein n=1 Tax=Reticulomyxa filosa TaxID=46433 RepID=X6P3Y3_RETFI|nr:hypothetical protein RFI_04239 [Reticulomyxa filosa]|eukprot:ETO32881.1 hypothetical protein RFI_04239 [Reticulomyxa filosa]
MKELNDIIATIGLKLGFKQIFLKKVAELKTKENEEIKGKESIEGLTNSQSLKANQEQVKTSSKKKDDQKGIIPVSFKSKEPASNNGRNIRRIMVIGETGSGKTTMLNSMMNYLFDVQFEDKFRYKLIFDEKNAKKSDQSQSQTAYVTPYFIELPKDKFDYDLNKITGDIKEYLESIESIHIVCFVIRASNGRLAVSQKYVFDCILKLFAQNIAENIFILFTFADGNKPVALSAVIDYNVKFAKYFKLNNSAFYNGFETDSKDNTLEDIDQEFTSMFWKLGMKSFEQLFIEVSRISPKSLTLTKEVLKERQALEVYVIRMKDRVTKGTSQLTELRQLIQAYADNEDIINSNKNYQISVQRLAFERVSLPSGVYSNICQNCNRTCHENCSTPNNSDKTGCFAMSNGYCTVCPGKCHWSHHSNLPFVYRRYVTTEVVTHNELKKNYVTATNNKRKLDQMIDAMTKEFSNIQQDVYEQINNIKKSLDRLNQIALRPNAAMLEDYLDIVIENEQHENKTGSQERVKQFQQIKEEQKYLARVLKGEYKPWEKELEDIRNRKVADIGLKLQ